MKNWQEEKLKRELLNWKATQSNSPQVGHKEMGGWRKENWEIKSELGKGPTAT